MFFVIAQGRLQTLLASVSNHGVFSKVLLLGISHQRHQVPSQCTAFFTAREAIQHPRLSDDGGDVGI